MQSVRPELLALLGPGYMTDAIIAAMDRLGREDAWRYYVTDALRTLAGMKRRYYDIINPEPADDRSGDEIAREIMAGMGLKVVE